MLRTARVDVCTGAIRRQAKFMPGVKLRLSGERERSESWSPDEGQRDLVDWLKARPLAEQGTMRGRSETLTNDGLDDLPTPKEPQLNIPRWAVTCMKGTRDA
jgi:hypothetical protein